MKGQEHRRGKCLGMPVLQERKRAPKWRGLFSDTRAFKKRQHHRRGKCLVIPVLQESTSSLSVAASARLWLIDSRESLNCGMTVWKILRWLPLHDV